MNKSQSSPGFAQFGRIFWMMLGPGILAVTAMFIRQGTGWRTPANYIFLITLAATILAVGWKCWAVIHSPSSTNQRRQRISIAM